MKTVIIYTNKENKSIIEAHQMKAKNPDAIIVESSNVKELSKALQGTGNKVHNFDKGLDKRHLKADKVVKPKAKKKAPVKKKASSKKK